MHGVTHSGCLSAGNARFYTVHQTLFSIFLVTHFVMRNYRVLHLSICKVALSLVDWVP